MVNWQVTATTLICESIGDEVTIMVYRDGSTKCTGDKQPGRKSRKPPVNRGCCGPDCPQAIQYRDKLFAEDSAKAKGQP